MLQILRKKAQSTFIQIIVVIIALVFIFWGVGANLSGDRQAALLVNGEEISFQQFQQAYDNAYQRMSDQFGGNMPKGLAETLGIKQQVINQLIQATLLRQGAKEMGIQVSSEEIRQIIEGMVQFQENGVFDIERYKTVLAANRMAPTKFEDSMRADLLSDTTIRDISKFASTATDFEIREIYSQQNEKIALKYVQVTPGQFIDQVTIDEQAVKAWYETVKENYQSEPQIKLEYLPFTYNKIGSKITVDANKIEQYYQDNIGQFKVPEQRHARHILLQATDKDPAERHQEQAAKAEEILKRAKSGEDFSALAREYSEGPSKDTGGDLGFFTAGQMVQAFDEVVFAMQPGEISEVVTTQFGYHIILLEEIQEAQTRPLDEVKAEIITTLQQQEAKGLAFQVANDAYEGIIGAGSLSKYVETHPDAPIEQTDFFVKSEAPAELQSDPQFLQKAFELNKGELSSLIEGDSGYVILFVDDVKEPEIPSFEAIKDVLIKDYQTARSREMAEKAAEEMLTKLREGNELDALAVDMGIPVVESGFLGQREPNKQTAFPSSLLGDAFLLSQSAPLPEKPGKVGDDFFVYVFIDRQIPSMPENSEEIAEYRDNLLQFKQQQLLAAWLRHQEVDAQITRHPSL